MLLNDLRDYIASLLEPDRFRDYCPNGVQVEGRAEVRRIASGVTASQRLLKAATAWNADAILSEGLPGQPRGRVVGGAQGPDPVVQA